MEWKKQIADKLLSRGQFVLGLKGLALKIKKRKIK
jgi:hypothetical protein